MSIIHGLLERITYHNEENDFVVAKLREKDKRELTTIVGNLSGINPGESLKLTGNWVHNKKFGEQFQVETFEVTIPATLLGIQKYLASGLIKGNVNDPIITTIAIIKPRRGRSIAIDVAGVGGLTVGDGGLSVLNCRVKIAISI